jgi:hypothetical protein
MQLQPALACVHPARAIDHSERGVQSAARAALQSAGYRALADLDCRVVNGSIVLSGSVSSYYLKQIAQAVVLRLATPWRVNNCVNVMGQ